MLDKLKLTDIVVWLEVWDMESPTTVRDIEELIKAQVQESLNLDYKRSSSISNKSRAEIAKDVSAFANSDGGLIIYGVEEKDHFPVKIDEGVEHGKFNREWLENVITSNIAPRIEDVQISQIPVSDGRSVFVVKVPKSFRGPHQERLESKRYYRRFNFKAEAMEDYEIREALNRRRVAPALVDVELKIKRGCVIFVMSNPADVPAHNMQFQFSEGMSWRKPSGSPKVLKEGIKFFPPGRTLSFTYNRYSSLLKEGSSDSTQFEVGVSYLHPKLDQRTNEVFYFDLLDFREAVIDKSDIEVMADELAEGLKNIVREVKKVERRLETISNIASATGLDLSVSTVENLRHIENRDGDIEKIHPLYCSPQVFIETLNVSRDVAWEFFKYFDGSSEAENIAQLEGVTEEVLERFRRYFVGIKVQKSAPHVPQAVYAEAPDLEPDN